MIILLTDGATNTGPDPVEAAREAANHGVRVYTVGFGTANGAIVGFGGWEMRAQLDEEALKRIADVTRAQYYRAGSPQDLEAVYKLLSKSVVVETKESEITSLLGGRGRAGAAIGRAVAALVQSHLLTIAPQSGIGFIPSSCGSMNCACVELERRRYRPRAARRAASGNKVRPAHRRR